MKIGLDTNLDNTLVVQLRNGRECDNRMYIDTNYLGKSSMVLVVV